jgi:PPM family protein phosphatase
VSAQSTSQPIICLRCGTANLSKAQQCTNCGAMLVVEAEDSGLIAYVSAHTNVGAVRENNEDNLGVWVLDGIVIGLVADGMGGAAAGEEASRLAVQSAQESLSAKEDLNNPSLLTETELSERLQDAVQQANQAIVKRANAVAGQQGMGTTSTVVAVRGNRLVVAHVGDSRVYLVDEQDKSIIQVTIDHSFVQALVASGHITPQQARFHPMGHVLYRALGQSLDLEVDSYARSLHQGDRVIVCSDGLTRHLAPEDIAAIALASEDVDTICHDLIEATLERGAEDNVSVIVVLLAAV